ncbi:hypothetical protein ACJRO7_003518 [Eucalyptus globulus]|uniref:Late embryogenesis abundant protein LEA-2 subgroup domain-containing protein n=1 Tax=Eucalyptus globulus TaxID=34317 RepID=A0ABD3IUW6_EUCGL
MSTARSFIPMSTAATAPSTTAAAAAAPSSSRSFKIVFRSMQSLVLLVFLIGAVITVARLILNPRPPAFRLDSLSLSGLPNVSDASSPPPKFDVRIRLTATNPNKKFGVVIGGVNLCLALIPSKCQLRPSSHNNKSSSEHYIGERRHGSFEVKASPSPGRGRRSKRSFQFTVDELLRKGSEVMSVKMDVSVKFMHAYWPSKRGSVVVECKDLRVGLSSTHIGNLKDGGKDCSVRFA